MTSDLLKENKDLRETIKKLEKEIGELKYQFHNLAEMDYSHQDRIEELGRENARLKKQLKIAESNADSCHDKLAELQEQTMKNTNIGVSCSTCYWNQFDEDEMCYNCCGLDKWKLNKTLLKGD